jgi:hypothetical protein
MFGLCDATKEVSIIAKLIRPSIGSFSTTSNNSNSFSTEPSVPSAMHRVFSAIVFSNDNFWHDCFKQTLSVKVPFERTLSETTP